MSDYTLIVAPAAVLVASVISGGLSWWASQRTIRHYVKQQEEQENETRQLLFKLLHDEISLRWKAEIGKYLHSLTKKKDVDSLRQFAEMQLKSEDLFVFKAVSSAFTNYFFLGDHRLISEIIHGHLLVCDLVDHKASVANWFEAKAQRAGIQGRRRSHVPNAKIDKGQFERAWGTLCEKINAIDKHFDALVTRLNSMN